MEEDKTMVNASQLEEEDDQVSTELAKVGNGEEALSAEGNSVKDEEHSSRMSAAKAFYRALYAGEETTAGKTDMGAGASTGTRGQELDTCANCQATEELLLRADARANEAEALYKRMAADFDNYRKRTDREREDQYSYGMQKAVEALLPAVDDLDRAQTSFTETADARSMLESLKLVYGRFAKCLEQLGIKPLDSVGQPFDPRLHEPVQQVETNDVPEGQVVHDLRRGYAMGDKIIRPSLVNVSTGGHVGLPADNITKSASADLDKPEATDYSPSSRGASATSSGSLRSIYEEDEQETQELPIVSRKNRLKHDKHKASEETSAADDATDSESAEKTKNQDSDS
jgi:molecular chaperone GrpE (heat shock protein)